MNIAWALANEFDVHYLGLQSYNNEKVDINVEGEKRTVKQLANLPRGDNKWDFGQRSLPKYLDSLDPEVLLTINDIQMIQHIPQTMCPDKIQLKLVDIPSKEFINNEALLRQLKGQVRKFKERFPRDTTWISYAPQDGDPPMPQWETIYKMADQVVAMSRYGKNIFKEYYNMDVPYIWHGVDSEVFHPQDKPEHLRDKFVVGDINRNQPRKQPVRTIEAFAKFAKNKEDTLLHMQKDWNDQFGWPLKYFTDIYGITNKCIKPGQVGMSREEVAKVYNAWDINLMGTGGEGFGLPTAEAAMCGIPTIAPDYTTSKELIDNKWPGPRGKLVDYDLFWDKMDVAAVRRSLIDIDDFANAMQYYYDKPETLAKHSENARKFAEKNFRMKNLQDDWIKLVKDSLNGNRR